MGQLAQRYINNPSDPLFGAGRLGIDGGDPFDGLEAPLQSGQSETSISVDSTGQHVVVGFNDFRGFSLSPVSVSGWMYSDDGGVTFTDGGQLPASANTQVFGDPEILYLGGSTFVYFSIFVNAGGIQTMCMHRSTDNGHTWTGPFEITPATISGHAADKEFCSVDPDTGRVMMAWADFSGPAILTTYSDDAASGSPPTWSSAATVAAAASGQQAPCPRFDGGTSNAYVVYRVGTTSAQNVAFAKSTDNGATWSAPVSINPTSFLTMDMVLGNDRSNTSPSLAVDNSGGTNDGNLYVVYSDNALVDGADITFQRSTDGGATFSSPVRLNADPGVDRPQWFPWVSVDNSNGRVWVSYYCQDNAESGDMTEYMAQYSDDGGATFTPPFPVSDRPFRAGFGNDTGQPNLGDYNQSVGLDGKQYFSFAMTPPAISYTSGVPSGSMEWPESIVRVLDGSKLPVRLRDVVFNDFNANGNIDPDERVDLSIELTAYASAVSGITATLASVTPGVTVLQGSTTFPNISAKATLDNDMPLAIRTSAAFAPGTPIEMELTVVGTGGSTTLPIRLHTGTPSTTTVFSEDFNSTAPGNLPAGWTPSHAGGANTVPWTTSDTAFGTTSNALFHSNSASAVRFERAFSPVFSVPSSSDWVELEFDIIYNLEDEPAFKYFAWDGMCLRVTDLGPTSGAPTLIRSVLAEAFAEEFATGDILHYPKHLPRSSNTAYFQDMSVWSGWSGGTRHVKMRFRGMEGRHAQLRWEYTEDNIAVGSASAPGGTTAGVLVDNIVLRSVEATYGPFAVDVLPRKTQSGFDQVGKVRIPVLAGVGGESIALSSDDPSVSVPANVTVLEGAYFATFPVSVSPVDVESVATIEATLGIETRTTSLTVLAPLFRAVTVAKNTVKGGQNPGARVALRGEAGPAGLLVALSSDSAAVEVPASATVPQGKMVEPFPITVHGVDSSTTATISGQSGLITKDVVLTVEPAELLSVELAAIEVVGGTNVPGNKVRLDGLAGPSGVQVTLISDSPSAATVPVGVTVGFDKRVAQFQLKTLPVFSTTTVTITASYNGTAKTATIDVNPVP